MSDITTLSRGKTIESTCEIVSAYVRNNPVPAANLAPLIQSVHATLHGLGIAVGVGTTQTPAVPVKSSVHPNHIVCLEDGKKLKTLKRYLGRCFNLTPDSYRTKWGLPHDYPMVAPNYSATRSALAKKSGLGRKAGDKRKR